MAFPTFIVGTGRCGSTMISNMLVKHPAILSISELFSSITDLGTLTAQAFPEGVIDTSQFWSILSTPYHKQNLLKRYGFLPSAIMPLFRGNTDIPPILLQTLPHITYEPVKLFDEIHTFVTSQPLALIQQHYLRLFTWLEQRFKRQAWVERSGGSLRYTDQFYRAFPDARFIHIVRDGRDAAISMSREPAFRMLLLTSQFVEKLGVDPFESPDRSRIGELSEELPYLLPECFDASIFRIYGRSPSLYGHYWSREIVRGLHMLEEVPSQRVLTIRYEDFLKEPEGSVKKMITFIDPAFVDEDWVRNIVPMVKPARSSWKDLPPHDQKRLNDACQPGFAALKALQVTWE